MTYLIDRLALLTGRERFALLAMALILSTVVVWVSIVAPTRARRAAVDWETGERLALSDWVLDRVAEQVRLSAASSKAKPSEPVSVSKLEKALVAAGLRKHVVEMSGEGDGTIALRFDEVEFVALMGWLSVSDPKWGYDIANLRLQASDIAGMVSADLTLQPQG
jgi:type II secretory pathway component PulM